MLFDYLDDINYDGWLSIELNQHTSNPRLAAGKTIDYLREMI
jgi:sugar phosphate isomerase/epimerase